MEKFDLTVQRCIQKRVQIMGEQGLRGPTARSSWKIRQNGGWEARRLAGFFDGNTHFVVISGGVELLNQ